MKTVLMTVLPAITLVAVVLVVVACTAEREPADYVIQDTPDVRSDEVGEIISGCQFAIVTFADELGPRTKAGIEDGYCSRLGEIGVSAVENVGDWDLTDEEKYYLKDPRFVWFSGCIMAARDLDSVDSDIGSNVVPTTQEMTDICFDASETGGR